MSARDSSVDIVKGIAILAVVLMHISYDYNSGILSPLGFMLEGAWRVPVFSLVAGYFIRDERLLQPISFIRGKVTSLYKLVLCFYVPAVLLHNVMLQIGWYDTVTEYGGKFMTYWDWSRMIKELVLTICLAGREPILGAMWYGYVLFMALCGYSIVSWAVSCVVKEESKREYVRCIVLALLCMAACSANHLFGFFIPRFNVTFMVMWMIYLGYIIRNKMRWTFTNGYVCFISAALFAHVVTSVKGGGIVFSSTTFPDILLLTVIPVCALYVISYFANKIKNTVLGRMLAYCGKESFYIMALQFVGFKICTYALRLIGINNSLSSLTAPAEDSVVLLLVYFAFGVFFPLAFMWAFRKLKGTLRNIYCSY